MFGIGIQELILIFIVALIFLGPKKLPEIAKSLGRATREFKKASQDFKTAIGLDDDTEPRPEKQQVSDRHTEACEIDAATSEIIIDADNSDSENSKKKTAGAENAG